MEISRTKNTITGTVFGIINKLLTLVFPFAIRTIFIRSIGIEYLGLNGLFTSVLQILNLAELGIGSALVFSMYKPIVDNDEEKICALMNLYRKYYRIIGAVVLALGLLVMPFLRFFIKGDAPADINIYILYAMHLASTVLTYILFAYRNSLFQAHQRLDVVSIITICVNIVSYALQIVFLLAFKNYYLYLSVTIAAQILINIIVALFSKKIYPRYFPKGQLEKEEVKTINKKVRDLFTAKISAAISNSFDTIVVSSFLGLTILGIYQNYFYIVSAVYGIIMIFYSSIQAGIGNYLLTNLKEKCAQLLDNINYITFFVLNFCCCCLITMYQPFMKIWVGDEYLLEYPLVIMFVVFLYAYILIRPAVTFKDAGGMWKEDRFRPLTSALVNLTLNLITVNWLGLYGVLGSTIVSYLFVSFPWLLYNINKHMFSIDIKKMIIKELLYTILIFSCCLACYFICSFIHLENEYLELLVYLSISFALPCVAFLITFGFTKENKYFMNLIKNLFFKLQKKRNQKNSQKTSE